MGLDDTFVKGDRVRYSERAVLDLTPMKPDQLGVIAATPRPGNLCVKVRWDGTKQGTYYSKDYISHADKPGGEGKGEAS